MQTQQLRDCVLAEDKSEDKRKFVMETQLMSVIYSHSPHVDWDWGWHASWKRMSTISGSRWN